MYTRLLGISCLGMAMAMNAVSVTELSSVAKNHPFSYDLGVTVVPAQQADAGVMICCHGYGHNKGIASIVRSYHAEDHLIGFNFPDYNIRGSSDHRLATFGTPHEIMPLLFLLKSCVSDLKLSTINLYGFSAGGGAVVNALAFLQPDTHDVLLATLGITPAIKQEILRALQRGIIILDCPLKSVEEVMDHRGRSKEFAIIAGNYVRNGMRPIDALHALDGVSLNILLHFQNPDEILGNRDDQEFSTRLHAVNVGYTQTVIGNDGGHNAPHMALWKAHAEFKQVT